MDTEKKSLLELINNYWGLILFMAGLIFHSLWTYFQVGNHKERISKLEERAEENEKSLDIFREEIKGDIREIKTATTFIKESISELKRK